jgi:hypothetical protein
VRGEPRYQRAVGRHADEAASPVSGPSPGETTPARTRQTGELETSGSSASRGRGLPAPCSGVTGRLSCSRLQGCRTTGGPLVDPGSGRGTARHADCHHRRAEPPDLRSRTHGRRLWAARTARSAAVSAASSRS